MGGTKEPPIKIEMLADGKKISIKTSCQYQEIQCLPSIIQKQENIR